MLHIAHTSVADLERLDQNCAIAERLLQSGVEGPEPREELERANGLRAFSCFLVRPLSHGIALTVVLLRSSSLHPCALPHV